EDGIRAKLVTGVQTCALPISFLCRVFGVVALGGRQHGPERPSHRRASGAAAGARRRPGAANGRKPFALPASEYAGLGEVKRIAQIGRASCSERVERSMLAG